MKLILIFMLVLCFGPGWRSHTNDYRVNVGYITEIREIEDDVADMVTVETDDGNLWEFRGYGYEGGEKVFVLFYRNGTEEIYDDEIASISVR